ncbi:DUF6380 family protein [Streptomyces cavernae]
MEESVNPFQGEPLGGKWHATLRSRAASLTSTACRASITLLGKAAGEGV